LILDVPEGSAGGVLTKHPDGREELAEPHLGAEPPDLIQPMQEFAPHINDNHILSPIRRHIERAWRMSGSDVPISDMPELSDPELAPRRRAKKGEKYSHDGDQCDQAPDSQPLCPTRSHGSILDAFRGDLWRFHTAKISLVSQSE
jgi:hypothetical protein